MDAIEFLWWVVGFAQPFSCPTQLQGNLSRIDKDTDTNTCMEILTNTDTGIALKTHINTAYQYGYVILVLVLVNVWAQLTHNLFLIKLIP